MDADATSSKKAVVAPADVPWSSQFCKRLQGCAKLRMTLELLDWKIALAKKKAAPTAALAAGGDAGAPAAGAGANAEGADVEGDGGDGHVTAEHVQQLVANGLHTDADADADLVLGGDEGQGRGNGRKQQRGG